MQNLETSSNEVKTFRYMYIGGFPSIPLKFWLVFIYAKNLE